MAKRLSKTEGYQVSEHLGTVGEGKKSNMALARRAGKGCCGQVQSGMALGK
jgi:hypothetical protein